MLVVHPSSRCDVCLDGYHWTTPDNAPHAISCGHIFCKTCLVSLDPATCPLCRKSFSPERVKRIHVDRPSQSESDAPAGSGPGGADGSGGPKEEAIRLLEQVSFVSGESTPLADAMVIVDGVNQWLRSQPDNPNSYRALRAAVGALERYKKLQDQHKTDKEAYKLLRAHYKQRRRAAEQDLALAQAVEANLLAKLEAQEAEFQRQLDMANSKLAAYRRRNGSSTSLDSLAGQPAAERKPKAITYKPSFSSSSSSEDEAVGADDPTAMKRHNRHTSRAPYRTHTKQRSRSESRPGHDNSWSAWSSAANSSMGSTLADSVEFGPSSSTSSFAKGKSRENSVVGMEDGPPKPSNTVSAHAHATFAAPQPLHPLNPLPEPPEPVSNALLPAFAHPLAPRPGGSGSRSGSGNPSPVKRSAAGAASAGRSLSEEWYAITGLPQPSASTEHSVSLQRHKTTKDKTTSSAVAGPSRAPTHGPSRSVDSGLNTPPAAHFLDTLAPAAPAPAPTSMPQGVGSLGLYSAPGSSSDKRRRARAGSRSESEAHPSSASSSSSRGRSGLVGSIVRENSAPAATTTATTGAAGGMGGLEIGLLGLPGSGHPPATAAGATGTGAADATARPLGMALGLRGGTNGPPVEVPERPESASSWGTVDSPPRNPNSLSDLGLGLGSVWTPPPAGSNPGARVRRAQSSRLALHVTNAAGGMANGSIAEEEEGVGALLLTPRNRSRSDPDLHEHVFARARSESDTHLVQNEDGGLVVSFLPHTPRVRHDRQPASGSGPGAAADNGRPALTQRAMTSHVVPNAVATSAQESTRPANVRSVSHSAASVPGGVTNATTNMAASAAGNVIYPQPPRPAAAPAPVPFVHAQRPPLLTQQSQPIVPQQQSAAPVSRRAEQAAARREARQQQQQQQQQQQAHTGYRSPAKTSPRTSAAQAQGQRTSPQVSAAQAQHQHHGGRSGSGSRAHRRRNTVNSYTPQNGSVALPQAAPAGPPMGYGVPVQPQQPYMQHHPSGPPPNAFPVNFVPMYAGGAGIGMGMGMGMGAPPPWATPIGPMVVPAPTPYAQPAVLNQRP